MADTQQHADGLTEDDDDDDDDDGILPLTLTKMRTKLGSKV